MGARRGRKTFDGGHRVAVGAERRDRQLCTGSPSISTCRRRSRPGVAALLDAEMAELAQKCPQALPGLGGLRERLPLISKS